MWREKWDRNMKEIKTRKIRKKKKSKGVIERRAGDRNKEGR